MWQLDKCLTSDSFLFTYLSDIQQMWILMKCSDSINTLRHTHIHTHIYIYTYTHSHTYRHTYTHTHTHSHTHIHIYSYTYTHSHICTHTHTHTHIYARTHIHTFTHTHTSLWNWRGRASKSTLETRHFEQKYFEERCIELKWHHRKVSRVL